MGIRQKFFALAGVAGVIMAIVSGVGYYLASTHLSSSVEREITDTMQGTANKLDGWLAAKKQVAVSAADLMAKQDDGTKSPEQLRSLLAVAGEDVNAVSDLIVGNSDGTIVGYRAGNLAPKLNPVTMRFYKLPKASGQVEFMDTYVDRITGKLVVSIAAPYRSASGEYRGAICEDIFLDVLSDVVKELKYQGEGTGYILDNNGNVIATEDSEALNKNAADLPGFQQEYERMTQQAAGFAKVEKDGTWLCDDSKYALDCRHPRTRRRNLWTAYDTQMDVWIADRGRNPAHRLGMPAICYWYDPPYPGTQGSCR